MRILVTGGAGFIGSHIVDAYLAEGHDVEVVDNLSTGQRAHVAPGVPLHEVSVRSPEFEEVVARFRPEVINHQAAQASVKVSSRDPAADLEANGAGTANVVAMAAKHAVRKVIYASSGGTVYGNPESLPVAESAPIRPVSAYGLSKWVGEEYVGLFHRQHGLDFTIFRPANAFGPRQDPYGEAGVVAIFTMKMLSGATCTIDGDGEQMKDYVYVGDVARANVLALERGSGDAYNIGSGRGTSVNQIFAALQQATGDRTPPEHGPPRPGDVRQFWLDCSHARDGLGWEPQVSFEEGIRLTVEGFRQLSP